MGNYYEGSFFVRLNNIPDKLRLILDGIKNKSYKDDFILFDENHDISCLHIEEGVLLYETDEALKENDVEFEVTEDMRYFTLGYNSFKKLLEENSEVISMCEQRGYWIKVSVCKKNYNKELELFLDYIRGFIDKDINPLIVGHIKDEDGYCDKDLYLNIEKFEELYNSRKFLCNGCDYCKKDSLCDNYELCKRAYDLGAKKEED